MLYGFGFTICSNERVLGQRYVSNNTCPPKEADDIKKYRVLYMFAAPYSYSVW